MLEDPRRSLEYSIMYTNIPNQTRGGKACTNLSLETKAEKRSNGGAFVKISSIWSAEET